MHEISRAGIAEDRVVFILAVDDQILPAVIRNFLSEGLLARESKGWALRSSSLREIT